MGEDEGRTMPKCRALFTAARDLAISPSIASSPKSQVKTVGLLVNHDEVSDFRF
jgi:hypothetical protein